MTRFIECDPLYLVYFLEEGVNDEILRNIFSAVDDEGRHSNVVEAINDRPPVENAE